MAGAGRRAWGSLVGGLAMLVFWQHSRRRKM
jgi:hypothetical protein